MISPTWKPCSAAIPPALTAETIGDVGRDRLDLHADPAARDAAFIAQLRDYTLHRVGRNCECDPDRTARRREDRGVDPNHVAVDVESRTAGIAFVHRCVDLNEIVVGTGADVAAARRDDTGGHGTAQPEGIADGKNPVTHSRSILGQIHEW